MAPKLWKSLFMEIRLSFSVALFCQCVKTCFVLFGIPLVGETIKIVIEDYVQHLSGYHFKLKFDPELLFNQRFQYQNRIAAEFNTVYHWHCLLPDTFQIQDQEYTYRQFVYNNSIMLEHGVSQMVTSFSKQRTGRVADGRHVPAAEQKVYKGSIDQRKQMRYQSLNAFQ